MKKAVILLSGGIDSATSLYLARKEGFECYCLIFDYGQRHKKEIESAKRIAKKAGCPRQVLSIRLPWKGSGLLDKKVPLPQGMDTRALEKKAETNIPVTYVPGRNIIFLSFALSFAEALGAQAIFIGAHSQDYSGYPDCRKDFLQAFKRVIDKGTKSGVEGLGIRIRAPLINKGKSEIIRLGIKLGVPLGLTWSCYRGAAKPCGRCDSCYFRARGFAEIGIPDPIVKDSKF